MRTYSLSRVVRSEIKLKDTSPGRLGAWFTRHLKSSHRSRARRIPVIFTILLRARNDRASVWLQPLWVLQHCEWGEEIAYIDKDRCSLTLTHHCQLTRPRNKTPWYLETHTSRGVCDSFQLGHEGSDQSVHWTLDGVVVWWRGDVTLCPSPVSIVN